MSPSFVRIKSFFLLYYFLDLKAVQLAGPSATRARALLQHAAAVLEDTCRMADLPSWRVQSFRCDTYSEGTTCYKRCMNVKAEEQKSFQESTNLFHYIDDLAESLWSWAARSFSRVFKYVFLLGIISLILLTFLSPCFCKKYLQCLCSLKNCCSTGTSRTLDGSYSRAPQSVI